LTNHATELGAVNQNPQHLFDCWSQVAERVRSADRLALFLDFDGTLASFRTRPEEVTLSDSTRRVLTRLGCHLQVRLFILSGRRLADLENRVGVPGLCYFGLHGWEGPNTATPKATARRVLHRVKRQVELELAGLRGVWIEEKGPILAVHVRGAAPHAVRRAGDIVGRVTKAFEPHLRVLPGNKVWEVMPQELEGKGAAVRALLREMPAGTLPVYVGDDTTDESAFAVLRHGITVCAGPRPTKAKFQVRGPREVRRFLEKVERELREIKPISTSDSSPLRICHPSATRSRTTSRSSGRGNLSLPQPFSTMTLPR